MNCDMVRKEILVDKASLSEETVRHLAECGDCSELLATWRTLKDVDTPPRVPPLSADFMIKREAARFAENRRSLSMAFRRWSGVCAVAACGLVICWLMIAMLRHVGPVNGLGGENIRLAADAGRLARTETQLKTPAPATEEAVVFSDWDVIGFEDDFFEIETKLEYCQTTLPLEETSKSTTSEDIFELGDDDAGDAS